MRDTVYENAEQGAMTDCDRTSEYITELQQYLGGLAPDMPQSFFHLAEILKAGAFELCRNKKTGDYLIPYMMNDAVEYCLILKQARMTGEFLEEEQVISAHIAREKIVEMGSVDLEAGGEAETLKVFRGQKCTKEVIREERLNDSKHQNCEEEVLRDSRHQSGMKETIEEKTLKAAKSQDCVKTAIDDDSKTKGRYILVLRQESGNTCTLMFKELEESCQCYQYHRIGHFWVKGQEHWRRLVYMVGTIYDKYEYLGSAFCNEQELELLELMGFAPFRYWSPIHESLDDYYENTQAGLERMMLLAAEAGDFDYLRMIKLYRLLKFKWVSRVLAWKLLLPKRQRLYELLVKKIDAASLQYPARDYGEARNQEIEEMRRKVAEDLYAKGYVGNYPFFAKSGKYTGMRDKVKQTSDGVNTHDGIGCTNASSKVQIYAAEEHPYVLDDMEYKDFEFRIRLMKTAQNQVQIIEEIEEEE